MLLNFDAHQSIISLDQLIHRLNSPKPFREYIRVLELLNLNQTAIQSYCSWDDHSYTRNIVTRNQNYDLLIMCWQKAQFSAIHNHGTSKCWMTVLQGQMQEKLYEVTPSNPQNRPPISVKQVADRIHSPGKTTCLKDRHIWHSLQVLRPKAITLHLYSPSLSHFSVYDAEVNLVRPK